MENDIVIFHFQSIYGATVPSGPWPPSKDASILLSLLFVSSILVFLGSVMCPSGRRPPVLFFVFPLVFYYEISHSVPFLGDPFIFHTIILKTANKSLNPVEMSKVIN